MPVRCALRRPLCEWLSADERSARASIPKFGQAYKFLKCGVYFSCANRDPTRGYNSVQLPPDDTNLGPNLEICLMMFERTVRNTRRTFTCNRYTND